MIPTRVFLIAAEGEDSAKKEKNRTKITKYRSFLENGRMYEIPDFRCEEDRVKYENDTASPFVKPDGTMDIQCSLEPDKNIRTPENDMK